jgi:predicted nuclease of restriction endonuclease-like (RecB) superfamily
MASTLPRLPEGYETFLGGLKERIRAAQIRAALAVNRELILLYWSIGRDILSRQETEGWGANVINRLAEDLGRAFPEVTGFRARNLRYMRAMAEAYPDADFVQQVVAQLPWGHQVRILDTVKSPTQREWYIRQAVQSGWSRNVLVHQIESGLYERQGKALTNFDRTLPEPQSELAQQLMKDPYNFDFLTLGPELLERDLERGLIEHVRDLILELGKGFAFLGSQQHLEVGGQDYYLDLLFYHVRLRCYVVIDLKIEDFKPEFAGKMNFYLSAVDDQLRHPDDKPSIGIILCKGRNEIIVEYALRDTNKPMGVAHYQLTPSLALPEGLRKELPTLAELSKEFPLLSVVKVRIEIERALNEIAQEQGLILGPRGVGLILRDLHKQGLLPDSAADLSRVMSAMNRAAHGVDVDAAQAQEAIQVGNRFLAELRKRRGETSPSQ